MANNPQAQEWEHDGKGTYTLKQPKALYPAKAYNVLLAESAQKIDSLITERDTLKQQVADLSTALSEAQRQLREFTA